MSDVIELFGIPTTSDADVAWGEVVHRQQCPFLHSRCIKVRKSQPDIAIGTCSVLYGKAKRPIVICPYRLLARGQVFVDCIHLLSLHEPGNELHIVREVSVPGGSVDYFLVSAFRGKVQDFVGIEFQTLDTTGTVWPARQRFLDGVGVGVVREDALSGKKYGMNWKMTAKTILIQLHHKVQTFEAVNKHLVLVLQDVMLEYLMSSFKFSHFSRARHGDPMHVHAYEMKRKDDNRYSLRLDSRLSTDTEGIAKSLGLQADANVGMEEIIRQLESKISGDTLFTLDAGGRVGL